MIFRSSVWLGFPGFIANISVVNGTDMWPSTFCVGSAVGTEIILPFFCSQLRVPPQEESERKTAVSERKCGCESEPGYDGFSLCHTLASAFMPPCAGPGQAGCWWWVRMWSSRITPIPRVLLCYSSQEHQASGVHQSQGRGTKRT